jgi:hypothetical protein
MNDITDHVLTIRHLAGDRVVLDWLSLLRMAEPLYFGARGRGAHISRIRDAWRCCQTSASRRIAAINATPPEAGLGRVERAWGGSGWWRVVEGAP